MTELNYTWSGDYLILDLSLSVQTNKSLGKYGRLRKAYLKEYHPVLFSSLLLSGKLYPHLQEIDQTVNIHLEQMMSKLMKEAGITEHMKATAPMHWAGLMNNCKIQAEEVILQELIYC